MAFNRENGRYTSFSPKILGDGIMSIRNYILDCLIDDSEAPNEIKFYFKKFHPSVNHNDIFKEINLMIHEELIVLSHEWRNEHGEFPYTLTAKGQKLWETINK